MIVILFSANLWFCWHFYGLTHPELPFRLSEVDRYEMCLKSGWSLSLVPKKLSNSLIFTLHHNTWILESFPFIIFQKQTITSFPYYEFISDDLQQLVVMVEERAGGWIVRSPCCPYKLTYNPVDESEQVHLYLSPYYGSRTIGMCQNYNNIVTDENQRCTNPPQNGTSTEIIDSCSCPKRDKTCMNWLTRI